MSLKIYNVMSKSIENFEPLDGKNVKMYACGITASGEAHIGHAYQAIVFDVIKKYLEYIGYNVTYVRNYTDVDDKIIIKARELKVSPTDYANKMMAKIDEELSQLNIEKPTIQSKATECIQDMIEFIQKLIDTGHAYATEYGDVFFKVDSFPEYGKLSNRVTEDGLSGVRKIVEPGKLDDKDFALWKKAGNDELFWQSPWGPGRPGWHIECSTMSMKYLGEMIDIHGGGRDLIFPHHENEIAQSEALTGKPFSKYWVHNGLIKINGQKMSKSLNNGILLGDLLKEYSADVIRLALLSNKYSSDMNIVDGAFDIIESKLYDINKTFAIIDEKTQNLTPNCDEMLQKVDAEFREAMDNDFNTVVAIANLWEYNTKLKSYIQSKDFQSALDLKEVIVKIYNKVLSIFNDEPKVFIQKIKEKHLLAQKIDENYINEQIEKRNQFRKEKNYVEADNIRKNLITLKIDLMDTVDGTKWDIIF